MNDFYRLTFLMGMILSCPVFSWTILSQGLRGWDTKALTVHVNSTDCPIPEAEVLAAVDAAIVLWNSVSSSSLTLSRSSVASTTTAAQFLAGTATDVPLIVCDTAFGTSNPGVDVDGVPAATRTGVTNPLNYAAILLNAEPGAGANIDELSNELLYLTLAHELGHALGLGHSSQASALMYYSISGKTVAFLSEDDRQGLTYLYPRNEFQGGAFGCASVHRDGSPLEPIKGLAMTIVLAILGCVLARHHALRIGQT